MALRGNHSALSTPACVCLRAPFASACLGLHRAHSSSHMQTSNLCHPHQNNYSEINTTIWPFSQWSNLEPGCESARGRWSNPCLMELISTVCSTFSRQPYYRCISKSFSVFSMPAMSPQPCLCGAQIRVKITSRINLDFDCLTYFLAVYIKQIRYEKKQRPFVLRSGWRWTGSVLVTALLLHAFPSPFS